MRTTKVHTIQLSGVSEEETQKDLMLEFQAQILETFNHVQNLDKVRGNVHAMSSDEVTYRNALQADISTQYTAFVVLQNTANVSEEYLAQLKESLEDLKKLEDVRPDITQMTLDEEDYRNRLVDKILSLSL